MAEEVSPVEIPEEKKEVAALPKTGDAVSEVIGMF